MNVHIYTPIQQGGTAYRDAQLLFQELIAKFGPTVTLLNGPFRKCMR